MGEDPSYWLTLGEDERPPLELAPSSAAGALLVPRGGAWFASRDIITALLAVDDRVGLSTTLSGTPLNVGALKGVHADAASRRGRKANRAASKERARLLRDGRAEDICFARWTARYNLMRTHAPSVLVVRSGQGNAATGGGDRRRHAVRRRYRSGGSTAAIVAATEALSAAGEERASEATGLPLRYDRYPDVCRLDEWLLQLGGVYSHGDSVDEHTHSGYTHGGRDGAALGGIGVWSVGAALHRCALPTPTGAWSVSAEQEFVIDEGLADAHW